MKRNIKLVVAVLLVTLAGCANMGQGPTGGKMDTTAPSFQKSSPENGSSNIRPGKIEILFNEYLQINDPTQNLVVSPPQKPNVSAKVIGKKLVVEFKDTLKENATYTLDFNNCIGDYTENNLIPNFCYTFSTGNEIDSMVLSGLLLDAETLQPVPNVLVGIYSQEEDSTFKTTPFERIGRTDAGGHFSIKGAAEKSYKIFALEDLNGNYFYDQESEGIAMQESPLPIPTKTIITKQDTIFKDSVTIDTIITRKTFCYKPDSIRLRFFHKEIKIQEIEKTDRTNRNSIIVYMRKFEPSVPTLHTLDIDARDWYICEHNIDADTLKYWITDPTVQSMDSLRLSIEYMKTDSVGNLVSQTDTFFANLSEQYVKKEKKEKETEEILKQKYEKRGKTRKRTNVMKLSSNSQTFEIDDLPYLQWGTPASSFDTIKFHLTYRKDNDTTDTETPVRITMDETQRKFFIHANIENAIRYKLAIDSAAVFDYFHNHNDKEEFSFSKKGEDDYCYIKLKLKNTGDKQPVIVQLLNGDDTQCKEAILENGEVKFNHLPPGSYYAKAIYDKNRNGKWDTGNYDEKIQPEEVFYFEKTLKVRKGWDLEEDWDILALPIERQRPIGIKTSKKKNEK